MLRVTRLHRPLHNDLRYTTIQTYRRRSTTQNMSSVKKSLTEIRAADAHRGNQRGKAPIPFKPETVEKDEEYNSVKIKVTKDYEERFVLFSGGTAEQMCKHFQQIDGVLKKQGRRELSKTHEDKVKDAKELLEGHTSMKPSDEEASKEASDDESSDDESSSDSDSSDETTKTKKKPTKLERWKQQRDKLRKAINSSQQIVDDQSGHAFRLQEGLFDVEPRAIYSKIHTEICLQAYDDADGNLVKTPRGQTWETFRMVRVEFMLTVLKKDAAEQERYYMLFNVVKPWGMSYRDFQMRMTTMNGYIPLLPCIKDSDMATDATVRMNVQITDHDMANLLLRACQPEWGAQWALVNGILPQGMRGLLTKMENIEQVMETQALNSKRQRNKEKIEQEKANPKSSAKGYTIPRKDKSSTSEKRKAKHCQLCEKHGGASHTHNTDNCRKWTKDGKLQPNFGRTKGNPGATIPGKPDQKDSKYTKKNYLVLEKKLKKAENRAKKARKSKKSRSRRRRNNLYSSDESSSSSDSE